MSKLSGLLNEIKDEEVAAAKKELLDYLTQAKTSGKKLAVDSAERLELWLVQVATGEIGRRDFRRNVEANRLKILQWKNTQTIESLARAQKAILTAIDIALNKILPALVV